MNKTGAADQLWFLDSLVTSRVSTSDDPDGISVLEHRMPYRSSPPVHLHRTEDEPFHVLEGEYRLKVQDQEQRAGPGTILLAPKGVPHTYRVESAQGGRCLTITVRGDFETVRTRAEPAGGTSGIAQAGRTAIRRRHAGAEGNRSPVWHRVRRAIAPVR